MCGALARCGPSTFGGSRRAILPDQTTYDYYHSTYWAVSRDEAKRADAGVRDFLAAHDRALAAKFDGYYGQIIGMASGGHRVVHLNYFCPSAVGTDEPYSRLGRLRAFVETPSWTRTIMEVEDGGDCFFSVDFDPATGSYENFRVNGDA